LPFGVASVTFGGMKWAILPVALILMPVAAHARGRPPLSDPVSLNIGLVCQWQDRCMAAQKKAMKRALNFVRKGQLPSWRVQLCNRNAGRSRYRVDWVGFENCVRNDTLRPLPAQIIIIKKRVRRLSQGAPAPRSSSPPSRALGERG
jgi:hypothetical protein